MSNSRKTLNHSQKTITPFRRTSSQLLSFDCVNVMATSSHTHSHTIRSVCRCEMGTPRFETKLLIAFQCTSPKTSGRSVQQWGNFHTSRSRSSIAWRGTRANRKRFNLRQFRFHVSSSIGTMSLYLSSSLQL